MKKILTIILLAFAITSMGQVTDTIYKPLAVQQMPDSLRPPTRLVWQGEKGVFLTDSQEKMTLEKLQFLLFS